MHPWRGFVLAASFWSKTQEFFVQVVGFYLFTFFSFFIKLTSPAPADSFSPAVEFCIGFKKQWIWGVLGYMFCFAFFFFHLLPLDVMTAPLIALVVSPLVGMYDWWWNLLQDPQQNRSPLGSLEKVMGVDWHRTFLPYYTSAWWKEEEALAIEYEGEVYM